MRYIKVFLLGVFFFLALVFFFQNQTPLSQQMDMSINLFFIPKMTSIKLPFYFLMIVAFLVGCLLTLAFLLWDKFKTSAKLMKSKWHVSALQREVEKLQKQLDLLKPSVAALPGKGLPATLDVSRNAAKKEDKKQPAPEAAEKKPDSAPADKSATEKPLADKQPADNAIGHVVTLSKTEK